MVGGSHEWVAGSELYEECDDIVSGASPFKVIELARIPKIQYRDRQGAVWDARAHCTAP